MRYAVNVADLTEDTILARMLIARHVAPGMPTVRAEPDRVDGDAVLLEVKDTTETTPDGRTRIVPSAEVFEAIRHIIRLKYHKNLLRLYASKTGKGGWKRV